MSKHTLIMLMGPAGTSKTVLAKKILDTHDDAIIISKNKLRKRVRYTYKKILEPEVNKVYYKEVSKALKNYSYVIADSTHITIESREQFFKHVRIPKKTKIIGVWIESSIEAAKKSNLTKPIYEQVPEEVIEHMFKYKISPLDFEPFDDILFLNKEQDISIYKNTNKIRKVFDSLANL